MRQSLRIGQIEHLGEVLISSATLSGTMKNILAKKIQLQNIFMLFSCSLWKDGCLCLIPRGSWNDSLLNENLPDKSIVVCEVKSFLPCGIANYLWIT